MKGRNSACRGTVPPVCGIANVAVLYRVAELATPSSLYSLTTALPPDRSAPICNCNPKACPEWVRSIPPSPESFKFSASPSTPSQEILRTPSPVKRLSKSSRFGSAGSSTLRESSPLLLVRFTKRSRSPPMASGAATAFVTGTPSLVLSRTDCCVRSKLSMVSTICPSTAFAETVRRLEIFSTKVVPPTD